MFVILYAKEDLGAGCIVHPPPPPSQMLSHMCGITRALVKPQDFTVLQLFYLSFTRRLLLTAEIPHLSGGPENRGHFPACFCFLYLFIFYRKQKYS